MVQIKSTMAQQIGEAAAVFEEQRTGHAPQTAAVVLSGDAVVIRLHEVLSPAEKALAKTPAGAAQVQEFHRQLFAHASEPLRQEIKRITNVEVREATLEVVPRSGMVVQVFLLASDMPTETWTGNNRVWQSRPIDESKERALGQREEMCEKEANQ